VVDLLLFRFEGTTNGRSPATSPSKVTARPVPVAPGQCITVPGADARCSAP